ncbi:hypothetical protein ILUMI_03477 [Ignelater luminosus]|uniref:Envelope fusion protein n=1 Tax=Ignelater luminosus TaxID=2038154 RepID=A0A8K0GM47_IGNLU|nr:hypothetical protein ILUMI_03477 [Ignelater luminosus]
MQILISSLLNLYLHLFETLEETVTFSKLATLHPAIITPEDLEQELLKIANLSDPFSLPYTPVHLSIPVYKKLITIKAYRKGALLTFLLEVPLINNQKSKSYLLHSEQSKVLTKEQCEEIRKEEYFCREIGDVITTPTCESELISFVRNNTCVIKWFVLTQLKVQQVQSDMWLIVTPRELIGTIKCKNRDYKYPFSGTYVIQLPHICTLVLGNQIFTTNVISLTINDVKLPNVTVNITLPIQKNLKIKDAHLSLEHINLNDIDKISDQFNHLTHHLLPDQNILACVPRVKRPLEHLFNSSLLLLIIKYYI